MLVRQHKDEPHDLDNPPRLLQVPYNEHFHIDQVLRQIQSTYKRANIQAQQIYIDILKRKNKNLNSHDIKYIYSLFTQTKANQICFEKQLDSIMSNQMDQKLIKRYFVRMIQIGIRKISYFWLNSHYLDFLVPQLIKFTKQVNTVFNDIHRVRTLDHHYHLIKMLFSQNSIIQQKIYELLIDEGYIMSMDQFYRINGVDLVGDRQYEGKSKKKVNLSLFESEDQFVDSNKQSLKTIIFSRGKIKEKEMKKTWAYSKDSSERIIGSMNINQSNVERNKTKIKSMLQSMVSVIKQSMEEDRGSKMNLQVIQQSYEETEKNKKDSVIEGKQQKQAQNGMMETRSRRNMTKRDSLFMFQTKKKLNEKKISIQLMSFFSNQFKSVISDTKDNNINFLSELLVASQVNLKDRGKNILKILKTSSSYIHSFKSMQSLQKIKDQRRRGKLIQLAENKKFIDTLSQIQNNIEDTEGYNIKRSSTQQKFSFKSVPGMYISVAKASQFKVGKEAMIMQRNNSNRKNNTKLIIRQNFGKDHIFENQLIVNELNYKELKDEEKKVKFTEVNGNSLAIGIIGQKSGILGQNEQDQVLRQIMNQSNQTMNNQISINKSASENYRMRSLIKGKHFQQNNKENTGQIEKQKKGQSSNSQEKNGLSLLKKKKLFEIKPNLKQYNYEIYDRIRRKVIFRN